MALLNYFNVGNIGFFMYIVFWKKIPTRQLFASKISMEKPSEILTKSLVWQTFSLLAENPTNIYRIKKKRGKGKGEKKPHRNNSHIFVCFFFRKRTKQLATAVSVKDLENGDVKVRWTDQKKMNDDLLVRLDKICSVFYWWDASSSNIYDFESLKKIKVEKSNF